MSNVNEDSDCSTDKIVRMFWRYFWRL